MTSISTMAVRNFERNAAPEDACIELLQPGDAFVDVRLERIGVPQAAKRDLRGDSGHEYLVVRTTAIRPATRRSLVRAASTSSGR